MVSIDLQFYSGAKFKKHKLSDQKDYHNWDTLERTGKMSQLVRVYGTKPDHVSLVLHRRGKLTPATYPLTSALVP